MQPVWDFTGENVPADQILEVQPLSFCASSGWNLLSLLALCRLPAKAIAALLAERKLQYRPEFLDPPACQAYHVTALLRRTCSVVVCPDANAGRRNLS